MSFFTRLPHGAFPTVNLEAVQHIADAPRFPLGCFILLHILIMCGNISSKKKVLVGLSFFHSRSGIICWFTQKSLQPMAVVLFGGSGGQNPKLLRLSANDMVSWAMSGWEKCEKCRGLSHLSHL
jgi:hypothetical protein